MQNIATDSDIRLTDPLYIVQFYNPETLKWATHMYCNSLFEAKEVAQNLIKIEFNRSRVAVCTETFSVIKQYDKYEED